MANPYRDARDAFPGYASASTNPVFGAADLVRSDSIRPSEEAALARRASLIGPDPLAITNRLTGQESNILFVDGLPSDCTRREVSHLFRPFRGFKDIRVVHKEPRRANEKGYVLCFVEFSEPKYAFTALQSLQDARDAFHGYASASINPVFGAADLVRTDSVRPSEEAALARRASLTGPEPLAITNRLTGQESNILFVDGLPSDCTRREVSHLFRPFRGFKDIRVVHKEPRRANEKGYVLCFVEFSEPKYAFTALQSLQGYVFEDKKPVVPPLSIRFAKFPFRPPSSSTARDERRRP